VRPIQNLLAIPDSDPNGINVCDSDTSTLAVTQQMFTNQKYTLYSLLYLGALVFSFYKLLPHINGFNALNGFPNLILSFFWSLFAFLMIFYLCMRFTKITKLCQRGVLYVDTSFSLFFIVIYLILIAYSMNVK
jgi:hypothetical protein